MRKIPVFVLTAAVMLCAGCAAAPVDVDPPVPGKSAVIITFDFKRNSGSASNQFAVWIEDEEGRFVKTVCATKFTAGGGYERRPDSLEVWVARRSAAERPVTDAVSVATPASGSLTYVWDLSSFDGAFVPDEVYRCYVEGTLRWGNHVLFSGEISVGGDNARIALSPVYYYVTGDNGPALTGASPETGMITNVMAEYVKK